MSAQNPSSNLVVLNPIPIQSIAASTTVTSSAIDVRGFRWALVICTTGTNAATAAGAMTITDSDASGGTYGGITDDGVNLGVSAQSAVIPIAAADDDAILWGQLDLQQCKDFMKFEYITGSGGSGIHNLTVVLSKTDDTERFVTPVYDANALKFDIKTRIKSESY